MFSKGKEYRFEKDEFMDLNYGWHIVGHHTLDEGFVTQIAPQLEELSKLERQADMPIITIKHEGNVYQRVIIKKKGFYVMESDGEEYYFAKDIISYRKTHGWHIINGKTLPDFMLELIAVELERLSSR